MKNFRIISLLPASTEMVYGLGLGKCLVGVSDDSDFPKEVQKLPQVVTTTLPPGLSSKEIDDRVRDAKHRGVGIFHIDQKLLKKLSPNLILSQELCEVCAIGTSEIKRAARVLKNNVRTISLEPESIADIMDNIILIGSLTGREKEARRLVGKLQDRIRFITLTLNPSPIEGEGDMRKRILIIEWLDPIMIAGHWVPEMVEMAGGKNLLTKPHEMSRRIEWKDVLKADPDVLIIAPCGFDISRAKKEMIGIKRRTGFRGIRAVRENNCYFVDANAYLTRPGPRIVDGVEILAEIINPEIFQKLHSASDWQKTSVINP